MIHFEFAVLGVPKAPRAKTRPAWQRKVQSAANRLFPPKWKVVATPVSVVVVYFHRGPASGVDVDNMAKPILDAIKETVIEDDQLVEQLISRRTRLHDGLYIRDVTPELARALDSGEDFVLVRVCDPPNHGVMP